MNAVTNIFVRKADEPEAGTVLDLYIKNLWPIAHFPPDLPTVAVAIYNAVTDGRVFVADQGGVIVGCAAFEMAKYWFTKNPMMWDMGIFVVPEARHTRAAYLLKLALETESKQLNVPLVFGASTTDEKVAPMLAKRHRKVAEVFVVRE